MNKEEALAKLCQYSTCNYKEQIWAPEAKELLEYWSGVERQIKQLQQENKELHNKIDKAIKYCDKTKEPYEESYGESFEEYDWVVDIARDLLEILKGDVDE